MKVGDEKEIQVTFPEEYHAEDLKGKEATFEIKVHEIKEKELPELDDELVKDISEFDTLEEYKANLRKTMEENAKQREKIEMENQLLEKVVQNAKVDIPEVMVENEIDAMVRDMDFRMRYQGLDLQSYLDMINTSMEDFRAQFKDDAYNRVKLQLTLEQIIKEEKIEATDEDLESEYERIAEQYKLDVERVKKDYQGQEEGLRRSLAVQKAVDFLMEHAVVVEKQVEKQEEQESKEQESKEEEAQE